MFISYLADCAIESDRMEPARRLDTIDEMQLDLYPARKEPAIDGTYESGLDLIAADG